MSASLVPPGPVKPRLRGVFHQVGFFIAILSGALLVIEAQGNHAKIAEWRRNGTTAPAHSSSDTRSLLLNDLILAYFGHVQVYYVKHDRPTSEQDNIRQTVSFIDSSLQR